MTPEAHMLKHLALAVILSGVGAMAAFGWMGIQADESDQLVPCECVTGSGHLN